VKRARNEWAQIDYDNGARKFIVVSEVYNNPTTAQLKGVAGFSWAAVLLPRLERQDIWDQIVQPPVDGSGNPIEVQIPPIEVYVCPSDTDATAVADLAGLSYNGNSGAWDRDTSGDFLIGNNVGDTVDNGVFQSLADYDRNFAKSPKVRLGTMKDGAGTTLMFAENIHKTYEPASPGPPLFSWLGNRIANEPMEQRFGMVWVVNTNPQPGGGLSDQEAINRNQSDSVVFPEDLPVFARPAGPHGSGVNVTFCDGHGAFIRDDIDYIVYQQLMTPNGRKCVDPMDHDADMSAFRNAPPLAEDDYQ
jgi:prepilin-type processing-associated H-X9-DG protein